jgi:hypothetical protein
MGYLFQNITIGTNDKHVLAMATAKRIRQNNRAKLAQLTTRTRIGRLLVNLASLNFGHRICRNLSKTKCRLNPMERIYTGSSP